MATGSADALSAVLPRRVPRITLRMCAIFLVPATVTIAWLSYVLAADELGRAADHWEASIMMVFGSFLAGSSPEGGGAVAFPVLTKVLEVPADVARTFSLSIQAVGMTIAVVIIFITRRTVELRVVMIAVPAGAAGFLLALFLIGETDSLFWKSKVSPAAVKVTFTIILAAMSYIMFVSLRRPNRGASRIPYWNRRIWIGMFLAAFLGGLITSLTGTGVNVMVFLFVVVMCGLHPRVGVPTSILIMASISLIGFLTLAVFDGQFDIGLGANGQVTSVGGTDVESLDPKRYDLFGLWLAAVPVVVWGAPLGTWVLHILREERLIAFVATLAAIEVVSTAILLDELHSDVALIAYFVVGMGVAMLGVTLLSKYRRSILALPDEAPADQPASQPAG